MNSLAFYDTLFISNKLSKKYGDAAISEAHLLAYLACLLSLYDGRPASEWDYLFVVGNAHAPYAREVEESIETLVENGFAAISTTDHEDYIQITESGISELDILSQFGNISWRLPYLNGACETLLLMPLSSVKTAIRNEPTMLSLAVHSTTIKADQLDIPHKKRRQSLVDESSASINVLYDQFDSLRKALGDKHLDMLIPAITWLQFMQEQINIIDNNNS